MTRAAKHEIRRMLVLSTGHLPGELLDNLGAAVETGADETRYGWLLWVPDDPQESSDAQEEPDPEPVLTIRKHARKLGCDYVLLDADGPEDAALPTFEDED